MERAKRDEMSLFCICGCNEGFRFEYVFDQIYISAITSVHSTFYQPLRSTIRDCLRNVFAKNRFVIAPIFGKEDLETLLHWLKKHRCNDEETNNAADLQFNKMLDEAEDYEVLLVPTQSRFDSLRGKLYRTGEIVLNEEGRKRLIRKLSNTIKNQGS